MTNHAVRAQIEMLATVLAVKPERVQHLERLSADALYDLRTGISAAVFDELAPIFARLSKLAPLVPDGVIASVVPKIVPPKMSGIAAGALGVDHPRRIQGVLKRIPPTYLAAAAPYLDPRVIPLLTPSLDPATLVPAAQELLRARQYATAALFVEHADPGLIAAFESGIDDNEGLLRTAAMTPKAQRLNEILRAFPSERLDAIIVDAAADSGDLLVTGLSVVSRLDLDLMQRFVGVLMDSLDQRGLTRLLRAARDWAATTELLLVIPALSPEDLQRVAAAPVLSETRTLASIADAADPRTQPGIDLLLARLADTPRDRLIEHMERRRANDGSAAHTLHG